MQRLHADNLAKQASELSENKIGELLKIIVRLLADIAVSVDSKKDW